MTVYGNGDRTHYDPKMISFTEATGAKVYIDNRQQDSKKANTAWTQGFIRAGVERPNQRIGIYVSCLSVAQAS